MMEGIICNVCGCTPCSSTCIEALADRIDSVIESMEIIYNYGFGEGLIDAKEKLLKDCVRLREIEEELRENDLILSTN